jgi:hypothetical protein
VLRLQLSETLVKMHDNKRLELIVEAIRYCQRVKAMGMPPSCYSKALREPIYFLWTCRSGTAKERLPRYRSRATIGLSFGDRQLVFDHAIPFKYMQAELLGLKDVTPSAVRTILLKYEVCALITRIEHEQLSVNGLQAAMPATWDGVDPLARYLAAGIELVPNE